MTDIDEMRRARARAVDAKRRKRDALARLRGENIAPTDAAPIRQHVKALVDLGWSYEAILNAAGCTGTAAGLRLVANGTSRRADRKWQAVLSMPVTLNVPESVPDTCLVPTLGATRRVRALMAAGWRHEDISEYIGRASHHISSGRYPKMLAFDWRIVHAAYEQLSLSDGGSTKSRGRAKAAGFVPPMAWNDIDDPNEQPRDWQYVPGTRAELFDDLTERGAGMSEVCAALKVSRDTLEKWCARHDRSAEFRALVARETAVRTWENQWTKGVA